MEASLQAHYHRVNNEAPILNYNGAAVKFNENGYYPTHPDVQLREKGRLGGWKTASKFCHRCEETYQLWLSDQRYRRSLETQGIAPLSLQSSEDAPRLSIEVSSPPPVDGQERQQNNSK